MKHYDPQTGELLAEVNDRTGETVHLAPGWNLTAVLQLIKGSICPHCPEEEPQPAECEDFQDWDGTGTKRCVCTGQKPPTSKEDWDQYKEEHGWPS